MIYDYDGEFNYAMNGLWRLLPPESFRDGLIAAAELRLCEHMHGKLKATIFLHYMMIVMIRVFEIEFVGT